MDVYDIELGSTGQGWQGAFYIAVEAVVLDILSDGESYGPVEVTVDDGSVYTGKLGEWSGAGAFTITEPGQLPRIIELDDVRGLKA